MPEPDGPQFQRLWDSAMAGAQANLDAISDEELDEAVAESMISDSISDMISASQIEETGHTQAGVTIDRHAQDNLDAISDDDLAEAVDVDLSLQAMVSADLSLQDRVFARRHHASYDAAEAMENVILPPESNDMNRSGPDYSQEDPFNFMNPEEARQAKAIEDMNKMLGE